MASSIIAMLLVLIPDRRRAAVPAGQRVPDREELALGRLAS
jgi:hypothetical protein